MKKVVIAFCLFALAFQSVAFAEPYKSSKVPPENILSKVVSKHGNGSERIIGQFKHSNEHYEVYYVYPNGEIYSNSLIRLDTNIWIYAGKSIVQK